jgi:hypothetical protein
MQIAQVEFFAVGLLCVVLVVGFLYIKSLQAKIETLELADKMNQTLIIEMQRDIDSNRQALAQRNETIKQLSVDHAEALSALDRTYATDEEACEWSAGKIPASVFKQICGQ